MGTIFTARWNSHQSKRWNRRWLVAPTLTPASPHRIGPPSFSAVECLFSRPKNS